jgi:hypothetical protein
VASDITGAAGDKHSHELDHLPIAPVMLSGAR